MRSEMKHEEKSKTVEKASSHFSIWHIVGGTVLALFAYGVVASLPDIKRYLRIRRM